jgi:hypothetical protein
MIRSTSRQDQEPVLEFAYAGDKLALNLAQSRRGCDRTGGDSQHFRYRVNNEAQHHVLDFKYHDAGLFIVVLSFQSKTLAQRDNRNDFATQVDHAINKVRGIRHSRKLLETDDLLHAQNVQAELFVADFEADELQ